MLRRFSPTYMACLYVLDIACGLFALSVAHDIRQVPISTPMLSINPREVPPSGMIFGLVALLFATILPVAGLYDPRRIVKALAEAQRVVLGVAASGAMFTGTLYLTQRVLPRLTFLYFMGIALVLLLASRVILRILHCILPWATRGPVALVVGAGPLAKATAQILAAGGIKIAGLVDDEPDRQSAEGPVPTLDGPFSVLAGFDQIPVLVERQKVTDIVFALPREAQDKLAHQLVSLWKLPLHVSMVPDFFDLGFARIRVDYLGGLAMIGLRDPAIDGFQRVAKRLLDLVFGATILLLALPLIAVIAIAIRLDSPGPVLFRQRRVGENGQLFTMYKFRTMVAGAERLQEAVNVFAPGGDVIHKRVDDPRVTRLGRILRRFSLDELPQLLNVLRGEMSLVGPRPELPWIVDQYRPWQYQRLAVPQGMTSWYVINGRSEKPMHLNTEEDLRYVRQYSFLQDIKILWQSVGAVMKGRGAF